MKKQVIFFSMLLLSAAVNAQDKVVRDFHIAAGRPVNSLDSNGWKTSGTFTLNLNQGALSNCAAGGEQPVFGINGIFNYTVNFKTGRNAWDNYFDLALGFQNATSFGKFRKIDDGLKNTRPPT